MKFDRVNKHYKERFYVKYNIDADGRSIACTMENALNVHIPH